MKPVIGITVSKLTDDVEKHKDAIPSAYAEAISKAGGLPLLIPNEYPLSDLADLLGKLDGLLFSGGGDIDPIHYGVQNDYYSHGISKGRDTLELALAKLALASELPVLGICRGFQLLNVALGGSLYTDIPTQRPSKINHSTLESDAHEVTVETHSRLFQILGSEHVRVNSRHHQAVRNLADGLQVTASASDGLIEAFELPGGRFFQAVQWHPENLPHRPEHRRIFESFIKSTA